MEKTSLVKKLYTKTTKDYTYTIAFLLIFSFFIFYVIRPNLLTVFETNSKIKELEETDRFYNEQINKIIELTSIFEIHREDFNLLDQAIGPNPELNKLLSDINTSTGEGALISERIDVFDIGLKDRQSDEKLKSFDINLNLAGSFEDTIALIRKIYGQRRLKLVPRLELASDKGQSTASGALKIRMQVEGYYL